MTITSNISAIQGLKAANALQTPASSTPSQGLLSFLDNILQQISAAKGGEVLPPSAQDMKATSEKIAEVLKKNGISEETIKNMSPKDLSDKIAALMKQEGVAVPASLQNVDDLSIKLAAMLQGNGQVEAKATLTADLAAGQAALLQDSQTKDDIANKILTLLENQQVSALNAQQIQQLKDYLAQLQNASGTLSADMTAKLSADVSTFLKGQGLPKADVEAMVASFTQTTQKAPVTTVQTDAAPQTGEEYLQSQMFKAPQARIGADTAAAAQTAVTNNNHASGNGDVTARISGINGVNPAMISEMAQQDGGFDANANGFGQQNAQTNPLGGLLQPAADTANNPNFINYVSAARDASATTQMINVQLQRGINAGMNSMTFQLDPMDLGRMDVKLKFGKDGSIKAHMTVDKPETLALLQKDVHHLQRALQQSGIDADENSLSFDLRQNSQGFEGYNGDGNNNGRDLSGASNDRSGGNNVLQAQLAIQSAGYITASGVNIMV